MPSKRAHLFSLRPTLVNRRRTLNPANDLKLESTETEELGAGTFRLFSLAAMWIPLQVFLNSTWHTHNFASDPINNSFFQNEPLVRETGCPLVSPVKPMSLERPRNPNHKKRGLDVIQRADGRTGGRRALGVNACCLFTHPPCEKRLIKNPPPHCETAGLRCSFDRTPKAQTQSPNSFPKTIVKRGRGLPTSDPSP
jgi:hypothetical protein